MDLDLTEAQRRLAEQARAVALGEIGPEASEVDRQQRFPQKAIAALAGHGMLGVCVPKEWAGAGLDTIACALVIEEVASACASTAAIACVQNLLVCEPILRFGSETQKRQWLPVLASGAKLGCFAFTEADGGSGLSGVATLAQREGDGFVLQGQKSFVTCAPVAELALVVAASSPGAKNGLSAFLVPTATAGVSLGPPHAKLGLRGAVSCSLALDGVRLPAHALLGSEGTGGDVLRFALDAGRIGAAALSVGVARAAFTAATRYALERRTNGAAISDHQAIQFKLAEMSTQIDAARLLTWRAAAARDAGGGASTYASMAKLVASEAASRAASDAVQILGGNGCLCDYPVERCFRDAKVTEIYEGTSEIQRLGIASALLKE
ncbi:MAG: acyl-CoA dehydrogenase family protein [Deltaproteobacteria bacterium]|nr:acyl-CoA dehydrogenase family protein [Deltaproteobacteria bacterium]